jgi:RNA polymerase sigma factor (TIGR02999 family)
MRQVVIEYARRRSAEKRGGGVRAATLDEQVIPIDEHAEWLLDLNEALERLAAHRVRLARVVECRFFAGLSNEETAEALGSSVRTVKRDWTFARSWLQRELGGTAAGR